MTYIYTGILSSDDLPNLLPEDSEKYVFRKIEHPTIKSGILFPEQIAHNIEKPNIDTKNLIKGVSSFGITNGVWIYYCCWGGDIELVSLASVKNSVLDMSTYSSNEYPDLHQLFYKYGISIQESGYFAPFERNYWGKYGY